MATPRMKYSISEDDIVEYQTGKPVAKSPPTPHWLRSPATIVPIESKDDFINRANAYFAECLDNETRPTITGFALAVGLPGPTSLIRLGQRIPELRHSISRCMTAVAHNYEAMIGHGNAAGPMFMLKNIPDFDPEEPVGSPGVQFFNERKEVLLTAEVYGAATDADEYAEADPLDAYLAIIKRTPSTGRANKPVSQGSSYHRRQALTIISGA